MDPNNGLAPLFEAQLELREPELVFIPSLDPATPGCFTSVVEGLINDIVKMASLIPRIALCHEIVSYEVLHYRWLSVASNSVVLNNGILHEYSFWFIIVKKTERRSDDGV